MAAIGLPNTAGIKQKERGRLLSESFEVIASLSSRIKDLAEALFGSVHCPCSKICAHGRRVAPQALGMSVCNLDYNSGFEELQSSILNN